MPDDLEPEIQAFARRLLAESEPREPFLLSPEWLQERLLAWATSDPAFRVKLLRFVDVLPALRTPAAVADHIRQYFRDDTPAVIHAGSELASQPLFRPVVSQVVRRGVYSMAHRFIAGETPAGAVDRLRDLAHHNTAYTVDLLGEATLSEPEADAYLDRYLDLIATLAREAPGLGRALPGVASAPEGGILSSSLSPGERAGVRGFSEDATDIWQDVPAVNISIKLSALDSQFEPAAPEHVSEAVRERLRPLLRAAREAGAFINVDMEQYRFKDLVHTAFADVLREPEFRDFTDIGIVVQAYLRDAEATIAHLRDLAVERGAPFSVRLVKGAYWEEERIVASQNAWPLPVWEEKWQTDASYERCTDALVAAWPHLRPCFASHNHRTIAQAMVKSRNAGLTAADIEFQFLYGMADELRTAVAKDGYRTRVYTPVGAVIPGMGYLVRRLLENTSNQSWFLRETSDTPVEELIAPPSPAQAADSSSLSLGERAGVRGPSEHGPGASREAEADPFVLRLSKDEPEVRARTGRRETAGDSTRAESESETRANGPVPGHSAHPFENTPPAAFHERHWRDAMRGALAAVERDFGRTYPLILDGKPAGETDHDLDDVRYPADPSVLIGRVARATVTDVETAVAAARAAFPAWRDRPASERAAALRRAANIMDMRRRELAATMVYESAKPWHEADGDVAEAIDYLNYYANEAERYGTPLRLGHALGEDNQYVYEGRGVAAIIAPWNFPLAIICGMASAAIASGNCAILKPAAQSPIIAFKLAGILSAAGLPPGVVQYLPGPGGTVGQALVEHRDVDVIAFTGSKNVGLGIVATAAQAKPGQRNVKRVIAEMGGKDAIIVDDDADLDQAVAGVVTSAFGYAGQKCSACSRLIVVGNAYEEVLARLAPAVASLMVGPPTDPATFVPPVISAQAQAKIQGYIQNGKKTATLLVEADLSSSLSPRERAGVRGQAAGAPESPDSSGPISSPLSSRERVRAWPEALEGARGTSNQSLSSSAKAAESGSSGANPRGTSNQSPSLMASDAGHASAADPTPAAYYVAPTVFTDVDPNDPLAREEIFGPVLSVFHVVTFDDAVALALDSDFALTGGVFSRNPRHLEQARREFRVGDLYINRKITGAIVGRQPFGGLRMSGVGDKAGGPDYLLQFLQPRVIAENTMRRGFAPES